MKNFKVLIAAFVAAAGLFIFGGIDAQAQYVINPGTDVAEGIKSAINAGDYDILIEPGTYTCTGLDGKGALIMSGTDITINAEGATIRATNTQNNPVLFVPRDGSVTGSITVNGGTWQGLNTAEVMRFRNTPTVTISNAVLEGGTRGLLAEASMGNSSVTLNNVQIKNPTGKGVLFTGLNTVALSNLTVTNPGEQGVYLSSCPNPNLSNITVSGSSKHGMYFTGCTNVTLNTANVSSSKDIGLNFDSVGTANLSNITVTGSAKQGIRLVSCNNATVATATVSGNTGTGIYSKAKANTFSNIMAKQNKEYGVQIDGATAASSISGSNITSNAKHNLFIKDSKAGVSVSNSTLGSSKGGYGLSVENAVVTLNNSNSNDNYWSGVRLTGKNSKLTVKGGTFNNNGLRPRKTVKNEDENAAGIGIYDGATLVISDATLSRNKNGCGIAPCGSKNAKVTLKATNCKCDNNGDHGIGAKPYATITVTGGSASNNKCHGIMLHTNCTANAINGVIIGNNKEIGLNINKNSKAKSVTNCKIFNNPKDNIHLSNSSKLEAMSGCDIYGSKGSGVGVYSKSAAVIGAGNKIYNNMKYGVVADGAKTTLQIKGSAKNPTLIYSNADTGVMVRKSAVCSNLKNAKIYSNKKHGVAVGSKGSVSLKSTVLEKNKRDGIRIQDSGSSAKIDSCTINSNKQNGVAVTSSGKVKKLNNNKIQKNAKIGVFVYSGGSIKEAKKNTIKKNKRFQVDVAPGCVSALKSKKK